MCRMCYFSTNIHIRHAVYAGKTFNTFKTFKAKQDLISATQNYVKSLCTPDSFFSEKNISNNNMMHFSLIFISVSQ